VPEYVNAHVGQVLPPACLLTVSPEPVGRKPKPVQVLRPPRLLYQAHDALAVVQADNPQAGSLFDCPPRGGKRRGGTPVAVCPQQPAKVHAVKLVRREHQNIAAIIGTQVAKVLAHRVSRTQIPASGLVGLLGGQDANEALAEWIELVGIANVAVKADA